MTYARWLPSIVVAAIVSVLPGAGLDGSRANASTTVNWNGGNTFNDDKITFAAFTANELTAIGGSAMYQGCCSNRTTSYTLQLKLNGEWTTILSWTYRPDETPKALSSLLPPVITFATSLVSGIKLTSSPDGSPSGDPNYTSFNFVTYVSRDEYYWQHKSYYDKKGMNYNDYLHCGDYDDYVRHMATFTFDLVPPHGPPPDPTPLPGALPLFLSGLGAMGLIGWRRKRTNAGAR